MAEPLTSQNKKKIITTTMASITPPKLHLLPTKTITNAAIKTEGIYDHNQSSQYLKMLCKSGRLKDALSVLHLTNQQHMQSSTYASLLHGCIAKKAIPEGKLVHSHMIEMGNLPDKFLENALINMYAKLERVADARRVFDQMPERDIASWTVAIAAHVRHGNPVEALVLFFQMQGAGFQPNKFTFASVLPACASLGALELGKEIHRDIARSGFVSDVYVGNALVDMYAKCGNIAYARNLFDNMPRRDLVTWNTLIAGYVHNGFVDEAVKVFEKMPERDVVSWNVMIAGYTQNGHVDKALRLFQMMPKRNLVSWNSMLAGYAQNGLIEEAVELYEKMPERNLVSWNAMIDGYAQNGHGEEALKLFQQMKLSNVNPSAQTFVSIFLVCASLAALEQGREFHEEVIRYGYQYDVFLGSALVDMYARCGSIETARHEFDKMHQRDVVSWTVMIGGYAMNGCGKDALEIFKQMQHSGTSPNDVTFLGVLSACCHAGLVDDGLQYFDCMRHRYCITPTMEHYGCMVNLLGRAGRLDEAQEFINKMPIKPDASVYRCLLGACKSHNNIELGEHVAERLFNLNPNDGVPYVLLSNIYATAGRWDDLEKVRKVMKDRKIKRNPGCSWIEINKQVHTFHVGDKSHPEVREIYAMLDKLSGQMKAAGYMPNTMPNTIAVLNDLEE